MKPRFAPIASLVGGLLGAAAWPSAAGLLYLTDEGGWDAPAPVAMAIAGAWLFFSVPGILVENRGDLTLFVIMSFWGTLGAYMAHVLARGVRGERP